MPQIGRDGKCTDVTYIIKQQRKCMPGSGKCVKNVEQEYVTPEVENLLNYERMREKIRNVYD
jgi:hypothetical protein